MPDASDLLAKLKDRRPSIRYDACEELRVAKSLPAEAEAALQLATRDTDSLVADAASRALATHRQAPSVPATLVSGTSTFRLPHMCARCGRPEDIVLVKIDSQNSRNYVLFRTVTSVEFSLPLCTRCHKSYDEAEARYWIAGGVCVFLGLIFGAVIGSLTIGSLIGGVFLGLIVAGPVAALARGPKVAHFDGRQFTFSNSEFQNEFVRLNTFSYRPPS